MSYADDNTPYPIADDINGVITSSEKASKVLLEWVENSLLKSNADKCHLLVSYRLSHHKSALSSTLLNH